MISNSHTQDDKLAFVNAIRWEKTSFVGDNVLVVVNKIELLDFEFDIATMIKPEELID